ncbi:MAG: hypothetical protein JWQ84_1493 [Mucilaginibacter sp.]|nr:hypothetical protein [Mucilaginibacter sp.]MDB5016661.1 hypothetical protein [Mucilaginibacter sp.]MDB5138296.1 hypothetical protein [Mucilaginibacter sp.]
MQKNKWVVFGLAGLISLSSCGIFHKSCNCPHFGVIKTGSDNRNIS